MKQALFAFLFFISLSLVGCDNKTAKDGEKPAETAAAGKDAVDLSEDATPAAGSADATPTGD